MEIDPPIQLCPYCGEPLRWVPFRWFDRGCYRCARCGDFPDLHDTVEGRQKRAKIPRHGGYVPEGSPARRRVLLIDTARDPRDLHALMLESIVSVVTAARAEDAISLAAASSFDAIIVDVGAPSASASEACALLKGNAFTAHVPIIVLIQPDAAGTTGSALRAYAAAVLMKPCPMERLVTALEAVVPIPLHRQPFEKDHRRHSVDSATASGRRSPAILVVDPDDDTVLAVQRELEPAGYVTVAARDFASARRLLDSEQPDLLVAALRLGDFNGLQLVATSERRTPTIILGENTVDEAESRALGAEYLGKPVEAAALATLVHVMMTTGRSGRTRRWVRKPITRRVPARLADRPAHLLNVSYGGLCLETEAPPDPPPSSLDVTFPTAQLRVHVEVAWRDQQNASWRCGAELPIVTAEWRTFVDALS